jgi:hypothetical protein
MEALCADARRPWPDAGLAVTSREERHGEPAHRGVPRQPIHQSGWNHVTATGQRAEGDDRPARPRDLFDLEPTEYGRRKNAFEAARRHWFVDQPSTEALLNETSDYLEDFFEEFSVLALRRRGGRRERLDPLDLLFGATRLQTHAEAVRGAVPPRRPR